jgi:hypothetical protein
MDPTSFDIAILGAPFDNAVSYRPGEEGYQTCIDLMVPLRHLEKH